MRREFRLIVIEPKDWTEDDFSEFFRRLKVEIDYHLSAGDWILEEVDE